MKGIQLRYGYKEIPFEFDESRFEVISREEERNTLSDLEIGRLFDQPFDANPIEEQIKTGESVLLVVPDATRKVGSGQIVNLLVRRLIANGTLPFEIGIIFATGLHRRVTPTEKAEIVTPFIARRVNMFDHDPSNLMGFLNLGKTGSGIPIELNRKLVESDHVILIGGIGFHYFAGFTGGRKLVCPGLASRRTIVGTHSLAFDSENIARAEGVGAGTLKGNPVHEEFLEIVEKVAPAYVFNTMTNDDGLVIDLICGNWKTSHVEACERFRRQHEIELAEKRELVIVSAGGENGDINLIQAHKALEAASKACIDGGSIILLAECRDGAGSSEFENALSIPVNHELGEALAANYTVGGQTAWSIREKTQRFDIKIVTKLDGELVAKTGMEKCRDLSEALSKTRQSRKGFIVPHGAKYLLRT